MKDFRYKLEQYKGINTRYTCPCCNQRKTFTRYIDTITGEHLPDKYGICRRLDKCSYQLNPYKDGYSQMIYESETGKFKGHWMPVKPIIKAPQIKPASFIPVELFKASLKEHETNHFVKFLIDLFGVEVASELVSRYFIATSKHWNGATVFWQIDTQGKVRTGKIMLYSPATGKRVKQPFNYITWVHKALKQAEFELRQCLFGEHLLKDKIRPVAIVESEKTAIIASAYLPQFIWLACGSLQNLSAERCSVLRGRTVILYPDLNGFERWTEKANDLAGLTTFTVSDLLETKASEAEREKGLDLADYLIRFDLKQFQAQKQAVPVQALTKPMERDNETGIAFQTWVAQNPNGGVFEFEGEKVKVLPQVKPITGKEKVLIFQRMAIKGWNNRKGESLKQKYFICWVNDMKQILAQAGINHKDFLNSLN